MPLPIELEDGMNSVVAPVAVFCTEMRSGCWTDEDAPPPWPLVEYSCRAAASAPRKPSSSVAVRASSSARISSSLRTVRGIWP
jgi:hypothetical protein